MVINKMSVRRRLLLLCFTMVTLIVCFSGYLIVQIREQLHAHTVTVEKVVVLSELTLLNKNLYQLLSNKLSGKAVDAALLSVDENIQSIKSNLHSEKHTHHGIVGTGSSEKLFALLDKIPLLVQDVKHTKNEKELFHLGEKAFEVLYNINIDVSEHDSHITSDHLHSSDIVLNTLRWLYYWMECEAWLVQEMIVSPAGRSDYFRQYVKASELQKQYFNKYISSGARSEHLKQVAGLFANTNFHKSELIRDRILSGQAIKNDLDGYIKMIEARNQLIERQTQDFHDHFKLELEAHIEQNRRQIIYVTLVLVSLLAFTFYLSLSTLFRINSKLGEILNIFGKLKSGDYEWKMKADGGDEFTSFAKSLNKITRDLNCYQSKLISAKESAEQANKLKSSFLASMSHEIRTPLNGIIGMTEILAESDLKQSQQEIIRDIDTSSQTLLVLLNDILDLSKIESGNLALSLANIDIRELIYEALNMVLVRASKQDVELGVDIDLDIPPILSIDGYRFKQVLLNLLTNAVKFTHRGIVNIEAELMSKESGSWLAIRVIDTGTGIDKHKQKAIFEPFTQENSTITQRFGGTGLGLAICRQLVELMGGTIKVDSTHGMGSCFEFEIPFEEPHEQPCRASISLNTLVIANGSSYTSLIERECQYYSIPYYVVESASEAVDMQYQVDLIIYCTDSHQNVSQDVAAIRAKYCGIEIVAFQHHLHFSPELACMVTPKLTLPIMGNRFKTVVENIAAQIKQPVLSGNINKFSYEVAEENSAKVLIVEDNLMNQKIASFFLEKAGMDYTIVSNGQEAVHAVQAGGKFIAVLMDCMMPIMDGLTATKKIRQWETEQGKQKLPIIALTASVLQEEIESCFEAGMDAYLPKPYKSQQLFDVFSELNVCRP
ncbi:ATP-binding protein [Vibrio marisflavi]|uniref:histidine kinase n=1 Tax=Vibrio marisflavi CECT 7928 TaxID=634439 RepID=A0ABN8E3P7_9VIBR|nr:ATP-binding protein [Vibrio marisflavi]CAH0537561.1 Sensor histidine kinase RcsC [Vibrio marisflavi CECT 7928]